MVNLGKHTIHGSYMILWDMDQITEPSIISSQFSSHVFEVKTSAPKPLSFISTLFAKKKCQGTQLIRPYVLLETFQIWKCCVYFDSVLSFARIHLEKKLAFKKCPKT